MVLKAPVDKPTQQPATSATALGRLALSCADVRSTPVPRVNHVPRAMHSAGRTRRAALLAMRRVGMTGVRRNFQRAGSPPLAATVLFAGLARLGAQGAHAPALAPRAHGWS